MSKWICRGGFWLLLVTFVTGAAFAQSAVDETVWEPLDKNTLQRPGIADPQLPYAYEPFRLNKDAMEGILRSAPEEFTGGADVLLTIPQPDGSLARFSIEHSLIVEPGLLAKFPELGETYRGQGVDDPSATIRFDLMPSGFHAVVLSPSGTYYVIPHNLDDPSAYISFYHNDSPSEWFEGECLVHGALRPELPELFDEPSAPAVISGATLRTYRLAVGITAEYTQTYGGGTVAGGLTAMTTTLNFVVAMYEREAAIRLVLVANNDLVVYTDTLTDGYTHENITNLLNENQSKLDTIIGTANYDIGHVFDGRTLTSGFSFQGQAGAIGNVCVTSGKARGVVIMRSVFANSVIASYITAHEMGHQFGATHTMNGTLTGCGPQRTGSSAYEPGSGSTLMAYRWNCGSQDIRSSDTYFHNNSLTQIVNYTTTGNGACRTPTATGNEPPAVSAGSNFTIPRLTPFSLTAVGSDLNGDPVSYTWEEFDLGPVSPPDTDTDGQARPIFRSYLGTSNPTRTFPSLTYILNNANAPPTSAPCPVGGGTCMVGEALPSISRTMNFRVTARDNQSIGGVNSANMQVIVAGQSGPFQVTVQNTPITWQGNTMQTVTWDVAGTNVAPVNAANVNISMSTDGGETFPVLLAENTPNDGSQAINVPNSPSSSARIRVAAAGNVFFDINNVNFAMTLGPAAAGLEGDISPRPDGDGVMLSGDVVQMRRFVAGLDTINPANNEFQRSDSAPRSTSGDGSLTSSDVVQSRRYVAGLDAVTNAGGPQLALDPGLRAMIGGSLLGKTIGGINELSLNAERNGVFSVELSAVSEVSAVSFVLRYDAAAMGRPVVSRGRLSEGVVITVNDTAPGELVILIDSASPLGKIGEAWSLIDVSFENRTTRHLIEFAGIPNASDTEGTSIPVQWLRGKTGR